MTFKLWRGARALVLKDKLKNKPNDGSWARMNVWSKGMVWGMHLVGTSRNEIRKLVAKTDGSTPSMKAIDDVLAKKRADKTWEGEADHPGRPQELSEKEREELLKLVIDERGQRKVTVTYCKKKLVFLRRVTDRTVVNALHDVGLKWLCRRMKAWVSPDHKKARKAYAKKMLKRHFETLRRFAYTDGTTFYLARAAEEKEQKNRLGLGRFVWRDSSGKDGLYDDNVAPSLYAKAQGLPVKIWGFLANGRLEYFVLPANGPKKTTHMNGKNYRKLVDSKFAAWRKSCFGSDEKVFLVQDHERCLWQDGCLASLRKAGCDVEQDYPPSSADLNAIENAWKLVRERLMETEPVDLESRSAFLTRLRRCVDWVNTNRAGQLRYLCTNQKERAEEVLRLKGARTSW